MSVRATEPCWYLVDMESGWGRAREHQSLSLQEINDHLGGHGILATNASLLDEGRANTNYRLRLTDGREAVLRIIQRDTASIPLEVELAERYGSRFLIPRVLAKDLRLSYLVTEWIAGESLQALAAEGRNAEVLSVGRDAGQILADISSVTYLRAGFLDGTLGVSQPWESAYDGLFDYLCQCAASAVAKGWAGKTLCDRCVLAWREREPDLRSAMQSPRLVHGDFKLQNLVVDEGRLRGVLDWEFAHSGTPLMSIGQMVRHEGSLPAGFRASFLDGLSKGPWDIPDGVWDLARLVDLCSLMDFLSRDSTGAEMAADVTRLIRATLGGT